MIWDFISYRPALELRTKEVEDIPEYLQSPVIFSILQAHWDKINTKDN